MGMDYLGQTPTDPKGEHLHLNWYGHTCRFRLLTMLHCEMEGWSVYNHGDVLERAVCNGFSRAIRQAIAERFLVDVTIDEGELTVTNEWALAEGLDFSQLSQENLDWLIQIADFFENCGGCEQW
jgi:hypothetical protein